MVNIADLNNIPPTLLSNIIDCLDDLLTWKDKYGNPSSIISGYNWFSSSPDFNQTFSFSNIHETTDYFKDMASDLNLLGYSSSTIKNALRKKGGAFYHELRFRVNDDQGNPLSGLKIKDLRTKEYIDLKKYSKPLIHYPEFEDADGLLVAEDIGYEINLNFSSEDNLFTLCDLFTRKANLEKYNDAGEVVVETSEEFTERNPWKDAYRTPVLIIGDAATKYKDKLPQFDQASKFCFRKEGNEISFIIQKALDSLKEMLHYDFLLKSGFKQELCLANKPFIKFVNDNSLILNINE